MKKKNKSLIKNIGLFTVGSFGSKILSFLLVPLYTTMLSTEEYGTVDIITSTVSLLTPILVLSIFDATLRFGMDPKYKKTDVLSTSVNIGIKGTLALVAGVLIIYFTNIIYVSEIYLIFLCVFFIVGVFGQIFNIYLRAKNQAKVIAISGIINTFVSCTCNVLLLLVFKWGIVGYMISNTIGGIIQIIYQIYVGDIYKDIKLFNYKDLSMPMIKYSSPLIANSISWWVNNASDRYILIFLTNVAENGIYSVAYKIPTILSMFQNIYYNAWSISAIAEFDKDDKDGFIGDNYSLYSFISLVVCSVILIVNIPLATFLYKGDYFVAWHYVPFLLMSTVFSGISQFEGSLFAATKNTKSVAKTTIIGAIVNVICNFIFIYFIGTIGAALATLIGYMTTWGLRTKYLHLFIKMKVRWNLHFLSVFVVVIQSILASIGIYWEIQIILFALLLMVNKKFVRLYAKKILSYI